MRAWTFPLVAALIVLAAPVAGAQTDLCSVTDKRLGELSGLVADGERWYAVNDGGTKSTVYVLGRDCRVQRVISGPTDPFDVEDLARGADGTFWLADTGDNDKKRATVALIALTPQGGTTLYRLTYPDGAHDTEALLLDRSGTPFLVTKNPLGRADVYRPVGQLVAPGPTALEKVGSLTFTPTDTQGGPVPTVVGSVAVTGGAVNPAGTLVALRTYTDAYLYPAPDGDVLAALKRQPVRVPLPNEKQGEAIALEPDGTLVSASEGVGEPIRVVPGAAERVAAPPTPEPEGRQAPSDEAAAAPADDGTSGRPGLSTVPAIGFTAVAIGAIVFFMRRRASRR